MNILEINNLLIKTGKFQLSIENLRVKRGDLYHIKGGNGRGKTLLLNTILGFINYTGNLKIFTNYTNGFINNDTLIPHLYPMEYLNSIRKMNKTFDYIFNCQKLAFELDFDLNTKTHIRNLSEGSKKKIGIISILGLESDLMILDNPFASLDSNSCEVLSSILMNKNSLINKNKENTVLFTSNQEIPGLIIDQTYTL